MHTYIPPTLASPAQLFLISSTFWKQVEGGPNVSGSGDCLVVIVPQFKYNLFFCNSRNFENCLCYKHTKHHWPWFPLCLSPFKLFSTLSKRSKADGLQFPGWFLTDKDSTFLLPERCYSQTTLFCCFNYKIKRNKPKRRNKKNSPWTCKCLRSWGGPARVLFLSP